MREGCESLGAAGPPFGQRCGAALAIVIADCAALLAFFRYDALRVFASHAGLSCEALGVEHRLCGFLEGNGVPRSLFFSFAIIALILALGLYDPRPLLNRLEQSRRPKGWLLLNAAGAVTFGMPYLLVAAGVPLAETAPRAPWLLLLGGAFMAGGLLLWLSDVRQLAGTVRAHHVLALTAIVFVPFAATEMQTIGWDASFLQAATLNTTAFLLEMMGQRVMTQPGEAVIGVDNFEVIVHHQCSGLSGIALVSAVMGGYVFALRRQLWIERALLLIPFAAAMSWVLNAVRISVLVMIGAKVSPELALNGFHGYAGWLAFSVLSALMLFAAENIGWIHRDGRLKIPAVPVLSDPIAAQIAPFIVLLASSLLTSAFFTDPEAGYPLRFGLMAVALLLFQKAYRAEIVPLDGLPVIVGAAVAAIWLGAVTSGTSRTVTDILCPVGYGTAALWIALRVAGFVLIVPLIEELFFRGYLLSRLDFGGVPGKAAALVLTSAAFGALHAQIWLAAGSGLLFGLLVLRKGRVTDAIIAHATANAGIAGWAMVAGDWSVIQ